VCPSPRRGDLCVKGEKVYRKSGEKVYTNWESTKEDDEHVWQQAHDCPCQAWQYKTRDNKS
jgi:hypothetical protein